MTTVKVEKFTYENVLESLERGKDDNVTVTECEDCESFSQTGWDKNDEAEFWHRYGS